MTRLAITGHRGLAPETLTRIDAALRETIAARLAAQPRDTGADRGSTTPPDDATADLHGISCLADGPDSLFAQAILDHGGHLTAVVPARTYRESLPTAHHLVYDRLLEAATEVIELDHEKSDSEAHQAGSLRMLDLADELLAVWDGKPARGYGGTADVVGAARARGTRITVIWPPDARRP